MAIISPYLYNSLLLTSCSNLPGIYGSTSWLINVALESISPPPTHTFTTHYTIILLFPLHSQTGALTCLILHLVKCTCNVYSSACQKIFVIYVGLPRLCLKFNFVLLVLGSPFLLLLPSVVQLRLAKEARLGT